jgi:8-oxo-dGTP diphosphatase
MTIRYQEVVCGFILPLVTAGGSKQKEEGVEFKLLCAQRPDDAEHFASMYEFVGGKVDPGENHHGALVREIKEELDVVVEIVEEIPAFHFNHAPKMDKKTGGQIEFQLYFYWCRLLPNRDGSEPIPKALASQRVVWLTPKEMNEVRFCPGDDDIIEALGNGTLRPGSLQRGTA